MKQLTCEMCGSTDVIKQEGIFVCQSCGTKYSVEEAKKMMVEGTVRIDNSEKLNNLYVLARRARAENNISNAAKYYAEILLDDPNSWEATYYNVHYSVLNQGNICTLQNINKIDGCVKSTFELIERYVSVENQLATFESIYSSYMWLISHIALILAETTSIEQSKTVRGAMCTSCFHVGYLLQTKYAQNGIALKAYKSAVELIQPNPSLVTDLSTDMVDTIYQKIRDIEPTYTPPKPLIPYKDGDGTEIAIGKVQTGHSEIQVGWVASPNSAGGNDVKISFRNDSDKQIKYIVFLVDALNAVGDVVPCTVRQQTTMRLQATGPYGGNRIVNNLYWENVWYNHSVKSAKVVGAEIEYVDGEKVHIGSGKIRMDSSAKSGCYIATAIYGSYDCPPVWTLRRYRDDILAETWYGRVLIHTYYAISPVLVRWFGNADWFKIIWRNYLNRMVQQLKNSGVEDTPYQDRSW